MLPKLLQPAPEAPPAIPKGVIVMWSGAGNAVPAGWTLCDGKNTTPDLRDKMVMGAGGKYAVGAKGGAETHSHAVSGNVGATTLSASQMPSHNHSVTTWRYSGNIQSYRFSSDFTNQQVGTAYTDTAGGSASHTHPLSGSTTGTGATLPPYYALAYIMKL